MAPSLIASYEVDSAAADTTSLVTPSFTPSNGEVVLVKVEAADSSCVIGAASGGSQTYTSRATSTVASNCGAALITAVISGSPGSMTITVPFSGTAEFHSMVVERWGSAALATTPATNGTKTGSGAPSSTVTTAAANSVVSWCNGDWNAVNPTTITYLSGATQDGLHDVHTTAYVAYYAYQLAVSAGSQTIGMSAPTGQRWTMLGIEIQAGAAPAAAPRPPLVINRAALFRAATR
jgi:hypothetical protein